MRNSATIGACAALASIASPAEAANVPAALYNKSISISYITILNGVSDRGTFSNPSNTMHTIYISDAGRIFSKRESWRGSSSQTGHGSPEQTASAFRFEGNRLIGTRQQLGGGASQLTISFDQGFQNCTASVQYGRESGKPYQWRGLQGELFTAKELPTTSTPTCSVRTGNAFAQ
jgi:hypothetical protein